jgi:uncharacterized protein (DUF2132 family)
LVPQGGLSEESPPDFLPSLSFMKPDNPKDPLEGMTLEKILTILVEHYGWEYLGKDIKVNCFNINPSIKSSLTFLRRTPWARTKVEELYLWHVERNKPR